MVATFCRAFAGDDTNDSAEPLGDIFERALVELFVEASHAVGVVVAVAEILRAETLELRRDHLRIEADEGAKLDADRRADDVFDELDDIAEAGPAPPQLWPQPATLSSSVRARPS